MLISQCKHTVISHLNETKCILYTHIIKHYKKNTKYLSLKAETTFSMDTVLAQVIIKPALRARVKTPPQTLMEKLSAASKKIQWAM